MTTKLLTKKRAKWAGARKHVKLKGNRLAYNAAANDRYVRALTSLVKQMTAQTIREVRKLYENNAFDSVEGVAMDANIASQARILTNKLTAKFDALFSRKSKLLADRMVGGMDKASRSALHASLKELSGGLSLKTDIMNKTLSTTMTATVAENVALIKSIPSEFMQQISGVIFRSITHGNGVADVIPALQKHEGVTLRRARNIALDQSRKAYNNLNAERMKDVGVKRFEWIHSGGGQKPRELHQQMSGKIYDFNNLPIIDERTGERGIPGQAINCRCTMAPVIEFENEE